MILMYAERYSALSTQHSALSTQHSALSTRLCPMSDRRPLTTRDARWAKALASFLAARRVAPNLISVFSVFAAAVAGGAFVYSGEAGGRARVISLLVAAAFIQLRLLCNMLDGMVAVEGKMASKS